MVGTSPHVPIHSGGPGLCVKVCHSKLNSCSMAGLGVKLGFPVDPKEKQYFSISVLCEVAEARL